jgi:hypothetical protein
MRTAKRSFTILQIRPSEVLNALLQNEKLCIAMIVMFLVWNMLAFFTSIWNLAPGPNWTPNYESPFNRLMYLAPLYWLPVGFSWLAAHCLGPFFTWFFGGKQ